MGSTKRNKAWSYTAGEKGRNRIRAFAEAKTGILMLEWYEGGRRRRASLGHKDEERAKRQADEAAAKLAKAEAPRSADPTLRELFDIYLREVTPTKGVSKRKHDHRCAEMFTRFFGARRKASTLSARDWTRFIRERREGAIVPKYGRPGAGAGNRVIAYDLKLLLAVLNWATLAGNSVDGGYLLDRNPLKGLPLPREESPKRPVMTHDRYEAMLAVAAEVDWRFHVALVLAHETGHRIGAIRRLRWVDVDLSGQAIRWSKHADKVGYEHVTPITLEAVQALRMAQEHAPGIGEAPVLPAPGDAAQPCSRHLMRDWWSRAEKAAELEHVDGMGWHSLRRKFATELKAQPLKDLCELGGWKDPQTVLKCYQRADEATMRRALELRRRSADS